MIADEDWARGSLVGQISDNLRGVASSRGAQFLDLQGALAGREVCSRTTSLVTDGSPPSETRSEWVRFLVSGIGQGDLQESFHPTPTPSARSAAASRCSTRAQAAPPAARTPRARGRAR